MTEKIDDILRMLRSMHESLTEIQQYVKELHEQWNKSSDMSDVVGEAIKKGISIKPPKGRTGPEDV